MTLKPILKILACWRLSAGDMETRELWAATLKTLREGGEHVLLGVLSNLTVTFTHDSVTILTPNMGVYDILAKYHTFFSSDKIKIKLKDTNSKLTIEQKLLNLFGERCTIKYE